MERRLRYKRLRPQKWGVEIGEWEMRARNQPLTLARQRGAGPVRCCCLCQEEQGDLVEVAFFFEPQLPHLSSGDEKTCSDWLAENRTDMNTL